MPPRYEAILAGAGGQGMIFAGVLLAEAAIRDGKNVVQTQSYGPEARGGASHSEVVISEGEIDFPKALQPNIAVCMSQEACDQFGRQVAKGGVLILDADHVLRAPTTRAVRVRLTTLAREVTGGEMGANVVALGLLASLTGIVSRPSLEQAVRARPSKRTTEANLKALAAGYEVAEQLRHLHR